LEDLLKIAGLSVTAVAFTSGTYQYWKAQRWRRAEFVAQEIRSMKADRLVQAAMLMLDWDGREIELNPDQPDPQKHWVVVTQEMVVSALRRHDQGPPFASHEAKIRDAFDRFLDYLERFNQFAEAGLVRASAFEPYLRYWCALIADERRAVSPALWAYMDFYGYRGVQRLLSSLGYAILIR
jgi:hypothetical protein